MKENLTSSIRVLLTALCIIGISIQCSDKCVVKTTYVYFEPVYTTSQQIKAATGIIPAQPLSNPGKIYLKDNRLYVNETGKGIHLIDNTNPASPQRVSFLNIPGNYDLAIQDNILYADSYVDLVMFDITDWSNVKEVNRLYSFFKNYNSMGFYADSVKGVVTTWAKKSAVSIQEDDCGPSQIYNWGGIYYQKGIAVPLAYAGTISTAALPTNSSTGISGSMARFTIIHNYLYAIDGSILAVADISNASTPQRKANQQLLTWPETLFHSGQNLFVGSRAGMAIFDLSLPDQPQLVSTYEHIYSCDPVVVQGNYAYVTLYNGDICHNNTNQLQVIDITNLKNPVLHSQYNLSNPHGLGIDQNLLFICDGNDGLKIYDASSPDGIDTRQLAHYSGINATDIIPFDNKAIVIGTDGLYQYDYSTISNVKLLSKIQITKP